MLPRRVLAVVGQRDQSHLLKLSMLMQKLRAPAVAHIWQLDVHEYVAGRNSTVARSASPGGACHVRVLH
jgi:hypothetical protein